MRALRLAAVRSHVVIAAAVVLLALGLFSSQLASAASTTTTSADLITTITPTFQQRVESFYPCSNCYFVFTAAVTNEGPNAARKTVVRISGVRITSVSFSHSPSAKCSISGDTLSCFPLPVGGTVTALIGVTALWCPGHDCVNTVTATAASSVTPDPNPGNNSATGEWSLLCYTSGNCGA